MEQLEISPHIVQKLKELSARTQTPIDDILRHLLDAYGDDLVSEMSVIPDDTDDDVTWTDEEVTELVTPGDPLTGKQMVVQGYIGGWEDMGIEDSVAWLKEQKARRRKKHQW